MAKSTSFIYRTDVHVSDRSPSSWKGDYPAEIWDNLRQIGRLAKERDVAAVIDGGDYFHVKSAWKNSHSLVRETADIHREYPCPVYADVGNHDVVYNDLESLHRQPLGVCFAAGIFTQLTEVNLGGLGEPNVRVVGVPYSPNRTLEELLAIQKKPGDDFLVAVVHALAGENPPKSVEDFFNEPVFRYDQLITKNGPDVWCFGHWHKDQGVVRIGHKQFVNLGAVSRGALINENLVRTPQVAFIEASPGKIIVEPIKLIVAPASDVFDIERKERMEKEGQEIDAFVAKLQSDAAFDPSLSIEANIQSLSFAAEVRSLALDYIERARAEVG